MHAMFPLPQLVCSKAHISALKTLNTFTCSFLSGMDTQLNLCPLIFASLNSFIGILGYVFMKSVGILEMRHLS